jgi:hypothetical protein
MATSADTHRIIATFYNYEAVRDQIIIAKQNNKCDYTFRLPKNIIGIRIDNKTWGTECSDPCTAGCCEILLYIILRKNQLPLQVATYYVKEAPIAYVTFIPSILKFLKEQKILDDLEIVPDDLLPRTAPFRGKI